MSASIDQPIKAGVVFNRGAIKPAWFIWSGRRYDVREVTQRWQTTEGRAMILHLGVTDGANLFELTFNQETLTWRLASIEAAGSL